MSDLAPAGLSRPFSAAGLPQMRPGMRGLQGLGLPLAALTAAMLLATEVPAQNWLPLISATTLPPDSIASTATTVANQEVLVYYDQLTGDTLAGPTLGSVTITGVTPPGRRLVRMEGNAGQTVMFGGLDLATGTLPSDTWQLLLNQSQTSGTWTRITAGPPGRFYHAMASLQNRDIYLYGGSGLGPATVFGDLWRFGSGAWQQLFPASASPGPRSGAQVSAGPGGSLILFGGRDASSVLHNDTWVYTPATNAWQLLTPAVNPPAREFGGMVYDGARDVVVMAGGSLMADTWELSTALGFHSWRPLPVGPTVSGPQFLLRDPLSGGIRAASDPNPSVGVGAPVEFLFQPSPMNFTTFPATPWTCSAVTGTTLRLQPTSLPLLGTAFNMNVLNAAPGAALLGLFELRGARTQIPLGGGCFGYLAGGAGMVIQGIANLGAASSFRVALTVGAAGVGLPIDFQVLHVSGNPAQFRTTQVVAATLGF